MSQGQACSLNQTYSQTYVPSYGGAHYAQPGPAYQGGYGGQYGGCGGGYANGGHNGTGGVGMSAGMAGLAGFWVAVKELNLSYYIGETLLFTIYTHYGNLT